MKQIKQLDVEPIDIVVINLYPFRETISKENVELEEAIENIDIGGPTMLSVITSYSIHYTKLYE